jgi:hypothetical protein
MKTFLKSVYSFFHEIGRTKAAAHLARVGKHDEALAVLNSK